MEYTQEMILNAFCSGVLLGPLVWIALIGSIKMMFKIIEHIDEALDKKILTIKK